MRPKPAKKPHDAVRCNDAVLKKEIEQFFDEIGTTGNLKTEAELVRRGCRFFMFHWRRAGGTVDDKGFPLLSSSDAPRKRQGR
jgi:hypothetical protein